MTIGTIDCSTNKTCLWILTKRCIEGIEEPEASINYFKEAFSRKRICYIPDILFHPHCNLKGKYFKCITVCSGLTVDVCLHKCMGLLAHMNVYMSRKGGLQMLCHSPVGSKTDMTAGCQDLQHVPVRCSMEGSLGGLTKNNMSVKGQRCFQLGQGTEK